MDYLENYNHWCRSCLSEEVQRELRSLVGNAEELKSRFGSQLQFGTAGMRGIMGVGSNRLNRYTVRRAAQGMAAWLAATDLPKTAAIAYDSRHNSALFAQICAVAFAEAGIKAWIFDRLAPTPMLSFAVRELGCGCGVVISASHNAGEYNGVKCYGPDGCQMTDEPAAEVTGKIAEIPLFVPEERTFESFVRDGSISYIEQDLWEKYYRTVLAETLQPEMLRAAGLRIVYTPLCGTGNEPVREVLGRVGVEIAVVRCQESPDGDFKTCEYPNPETDTALSESYKLADRTPCDLILGTDPDADRVAIAIPDRRGGYRKFTGNDVGCLLLEYILKNRSAQDSIPEGAIAIRSIVSSPMADKIAENYGVSMIPVLTGFKYIGGEILRLEKIGQLEKFLFGFEESCGYLKGTYARDKDAIVASVLICELAAELKANGKTVYDALNDLYKQYGFHLSHVQSLELTGADAMEKAASLMADLRGNTPENIGGECVTVLRDYKTGIERNLERSAERMIHLPKSNVLEFVLGNRGSVIVRPSGTEPKVKFYFTAIGEDENAAQMLMERLKKYFTN